MRHWVYEDARGTLEVVAADHVDQQDIAEVLNWLPQCRQTEIERPQWFKQEWLFAVVVNNEIRRVWS